MLYNWVKYSQIQLMPKGNSPTEIFSEHSVIPILLIMTSHVQGFTIGETETDHWLQLVTFGSYQS
jgi:hypothetical protein